MQDQGTSNFPWRHGVFVTLCAISLMGAVAIFGQLVVGSVVNLLVSTLTPEYVNSLKTPMGEVLVSSVAYIVAGGAAILLGWSWCGGGSLLTMVGGEPRIFREKFVSNMGYALRGYGLMFGIVLVVMISMTLLLPHGIDIKPTDNASEFAKTLHGWPMILFAVQSVILAPFFEEFLCRGLMYNMLRSGVLANWGKYVSENVATIYGIGMSAFYFAAMHMSLTGMLVLFPAGIAFAVVYRRSGNIYASIQMHMIMNLIATIAAALH